MERTSSKSLGPPARVVLPPPVARRTAGATVADSLRRAILAGDLAPGTPLRQEALAAHFRVSRMPVRDALKRLAAEALVDLAPHRGAVVARLSLDDAADVMAIRVGLEPQALRLSIPRLTDADLAHAETLLARMDGADNLARQGDLNAAFHGCLMERCPAPRLKALVAEHLAAADRYLRFGLGVLEHRGPSQREHRAILAAARARDAPGAAALMETHIRRGGEVLIAFLKTSGLG